MAKPPTRVTEIPSVWPDVNWGEIDGIAAIWPTTQLIPGPVQACLLFGVGRSDETLLTSGATHLVEHLALSTLGRQPYLYNGQVSPASTRFLVMGTPEQVAEFFGTLAANLRALPVERFEQEVSVLRVEGQKHNAGQLGFDLSLRFGPNGPGLLGWPEHGLHRLDPAEARGWAARWFTAANAVLWLSAPPPPELDLSALPKGRKRRRHAPGPELIECPTWVPARTNMISVSVTSEQQWALTPGLAIARDRALERLRTHAGVTYTVDFAHVRLPGGKALEFLSADGAQGSHGAVLEGMLEVVEQLSEDGPTGDELALWQDLRRQFHNAPQALTGYLDSSAERRVLGLSTPTRDEVDQRLDELTADQISAELQAVGKSLLAIGPSEIGDDVIGLSSITNWSDRQLLGDEYQPIDGRERGTLVIGDEGISWILDETHFRTVPWNTVVGVTAWDNGSRTVIGANGSSVVVVPWNWRQGEDLPELIDKSVGDRLIRLGAGITDTNNGGVGENWSAKVQWLASLMGARCEKRSVDLVLRTDGLLLLHRAVVAIPSTRLEELRTKEPADLMADDPHAKWWPTSEIERVQLDKPLILRFGKSKVSGMLRIYLHGRGPVLVELRSPDQVKTTQDTFPKLLGPRYISRV